jgi:hypothetical protein
MIIYLHKIRVEISTRFIRLLNGLCDDDDEEEGEEENLHGYQSSVKTGHAVELHESEVTGLVVTTLEVPCFG